MIAQDFPEEIWTDDERYSDRVIYHELYLYRDRPFTPLNHPNVGLHEAYVINQKYCSAFDSNDDYAYFRDNENNIHVRYLSGLNLVHPPCDWLSGRGIEQHFIWHVENENGCCRTTSISSSPDVDIAPLSGYEVVRDATGQIIDGKLLSYLSMKTVSMAAQEYNIRNLASTAERHLNTVSPLLISLFGSEIAAIFDHTVAEAFQRQHIDRSKTIMKAFVNIQWTNSIYNRIIRHAGQFVPTDRLYMLIVENWKTIASIISILVMLLGLQILLTIGTNIGAEAVEFDDIKKNFREVRYQVGGYGWRCNLFFLTALFGLSLFKQKEFNLMSLFAVILEEVAKSRLPWPFILAVVEKQYTLRHPWRHFFFHIFCSIFFDWFAKFFGISFIISFLMRIAIHLLTIYLTDELYTLWEVIRPSWQDPNMIEAYIDEARYICEPLKMKDMRLLRTNSNLSTEPPPGENYMRPRLFLRDRSEPIVDGFYLVLATRRPFYAPARTMTNMLVAISQRLLKPPIMSPEAQRIFWFRNVDPHNIVHFPFMSIIYTGALANKFVDHFKGSHHSKYVREMAKFKSTGRLNMSIKMFMKYDEILMNPKPRTIACVDVSLQCRIGPEIMVATDRLHSLYNGEMSYHLAFDNCPIYVFWASSAGVQQLSSFYERAISDPQGHYLMVAGDDAIHINRNKVQMTDASSYDQSQSFGPLNHEREVLRLLGVSNDVLHLLKDISILPYYVTRNAVSQPSVICREKRPIRDTGGADTTLGNSINMIAMWLGVLQRRDLSWFEQCGFVMKIKEAPIRQARFLKGLWWYIYINLDGVLSPHYIWGPCPTKVFKYGKTLVDPRTIYGGNLDSAILKHLNEVSNSIYGFDYVPLIRAFLNRYFTARVQIENAAQKIILPNKIDWREDPANPILVQASEWYQVPVDELVFIEKSIETESIAKFINSPNLYSMIGQDNE